MLRQLLRSSFLLCATGACLAQVKLTPFALPQTGQAGSAIVSIVGTGFPTSSSSVSSSGTAAVTTPNTTVSIAATCNGSSLINLTPLSTKVTANGVGNVSFKLPTTLQAGTYALSVGGTTASGAAFISTNCATIKVTPQNNFVTVSNGKLTLGGLPFRFSGGNEAGLKNTSQATTDQMLATAAANQFSVVRVWTFIDIGNADGSNSTAGKENNLYFQYWNGSAPAFNDGPTGLQNLDYAVYRAGQNGMKLILSLTNNWVPGGGMDQYVRWAGDSFHDQFYTDPKIRAWYEGWISHLLNHVNAYSGVAYKDDPAIMIWELANEPRCGGQGPYPASSTCSTQTLTNWVTSESAFIKGIDHNHLVGVGDEGFFCNSYGDTSGCSQGDDAATFAAVPSIDVVTWHLYNQTSGTDQNYGTEFIHNHLSLAQGLGKPAYMGEYGLQSGNQRNVIYNTWQQAVFQGGGAGALVWDIAGGQPGPIAAESNTGLDLFDQAPLLQTLHNFAQEAAVNGQLSFIPSADDQWLSTTLNTASTLNPLQNVVTYGGAAVDGSSLDLDPSTPGQQSSAHAYGGTFTAAGSTVTFTPDSNFNGQAVAPFTVRDTKGNLSNTAYLYANVKPTANVAYEIESFETGANGWGATGVTTSQSTQYATDGPHSLRAVVPATSGGAWFGIGFSSPLDLSNRPTLSVDMTVTGISGASTDIVVQSGSNYLWCQSNAWPWLNANSTTTVTVPLTPAGLGCTGQTPNFGQIDAIFVWVAPGGTYYIDNVRAAPVPANLQPISLFSFEDGVENWAPQNGNGTVAQTTSFYTDGAYGLQVTSPGGYFGTGGLNLDLSSKSALAFDIDTPGNGNSINVEVYTAGSSTPCNTSWGWAQGANSTVSIPFNTLTGCTLDLTHVTGIYLWFSSGMYYIDNVRAQ